MRKQSAQGQVDRSSTLVDLLVETPVFSGLTAPSRARARDLAVARTFNKGATIAADGECWPRVLLVAEGQVRLVKASEGGRALAALTLGPGDGFFSQTLFDGQPLPASLEAATACRVYLWDGPALMSLVRACPQALWELVGSLVGQMRRAAAMIDSLAFQPLPRRLARLLLEQFGGTRATTEPAPRSMTLDEMAAQIGSTREVVCRLLYRFADEGLISITRTDFYLRDRARLAEMAGEAEGASDRARS